MKTIFLIGLMILTSVSFAQVKPVKPLEHKIDHNWTKKQYERATNDTIPKVYIKQKNNDLSPLVYLNNQYVEHLSLKTIYPDIIEKIEIEKDSVNLNGNKYYGKIFISLKKGYKPALISLNELKRKYTNVTSPTIFTINREIIEEDYNKVLLDEKFIHNIEISEITIPKEEIDITMINIFTRTQENIENSNRIYIR